MEEEYRIPVDDDTGLLIEDFNARVGKERGGIENVIEAFGEETKNCGENLINTQDIDGTSRVDNLIRNLHYRLYNMLRQKNN